MSLNDFKKGIAYSAIARYGTMVIQLGMNIVLARLLSPTDFGIVAIVQVFQNFFNMLADMGIGPAIIQNKTLNKNDISILYRLSIMLGLILAIIFAVLGYPISVFYSNPVFTQIFLVLSLSVFFATIVVVPNAILQKNKEFKLVNVSILIAGVTKGVVSIILAFLNFSYYAIIIGGLLEVIIRYVLLRFNTSFDGKVKFKSEPIIKIWNFSRNQFAFNFVNYFSRNIDSLLIGRYFPAASLGYYNKAYQLTGYPNQILTGVITPIVQPILSEYENEKNVIKNAYLKISNLLANIGIPVTIFMFLYSEDIILLLFGDQWVQSTTSLRILSLTIWVQMISSSTGSIYQSANRTDLLLFTGVQSSIFNIVAVIIGVQMNSIENVATAVLISFTINFIINNYLLMNIALNSKYFEFINNLVKPFIVGIIVLIFCMFTPKLMFNPFINLLIYGVIFCLGLLMGLIVTKQLKELLKLVK